MYTVLLCFSSTVEVISHVEMELVVNRSMERNLQVRIYEQPVSDRTKQSLLNQYISNGNTNDYVLGVDENFELKHTR